MIVSYIAPIRYYNLDVPVETDVYYDTADTWDLLFNGEQHQVYFPCSLVELLRKDISPTEKQGSFKDIPVYPWGMSCEL